MLMHAKRFVTYFFMSKHFSRIAKVMQLKAKNKVLDKK